MLVIGIDPGSQRTGWGIVEDRGASPGLVDCGIIHASAKHGLSFSARLAIIYEELAAALDRYMPDCAAIEQVFTAKNAQSALKLGQARGVAVGACAGRGIPVFDYEPTLVKKAIVGAGRAEKEQVAFMARRLLNIRGPQMPLDTTDALAIALCHLGQARFLAIAGRAGIAV